VWSPLSLGRTGPHGTRIFHQFTNQIGRTICGETSLLEVGHNPGPSFVRGFSIIKTHISPSQEVLDGSWNLGNQDVRDIIQFWNRITKGILDKSYVILGTHIIPSLGHEVLGICPTFQIEGNFVS